MNVLAYILNRIRLQFRIFTCAIFVFSFHAGNMAQAGQSIEAITAWLAETYDNPSILRQERDAIVVKHAGGIKRILLSEIPTDLQQASQDIIYAPLDKELVVVFTNASPALRRNILDSANRVYTVVGGKIEPIRNYYRFNGTVSHIIKPNHYVIRDNIAIFDTNTFSIGDSTKGLAVGDGTVSGTTRIKRFKSVLIPFREVVAQSDDLGNCYLDHMSIYLMRPHPLNYEVLDGTVISGYAVDEGMHKYVDTLGAVRRIQKWRMLTTSEVEAETEYISEETIYSKYSVIQCVPMSESEFLTYLRANISLTFDAALQHPCLKCESRGKTISTHEYEPVQVPCRNCGGTGRIAVSSTSDSSSDKKIRHGTVQSATIVTYRNCAGCSGTGRSSGRRLREVACSECIGKGSREVTRPLTCKY